MHLNDLGPWCVVWFGGDTRLAHAFFADRSQAIVFRNTKGGELYLKHTDGSLKRQ